VDEARFVKTILMISPDSLYGLWKLPQMRIEKDGKGYSFETSSTVGSAKIQVMSDILQV